VNKCGSDDVDCKIEATELKSEMTAVTTSSSLHSISLLDNSGVDPYIFSQLVQKIKEI
jgi:hypothetical protein